MNKQKILVQKIRAAASAAAEAADAWDGAYYFAEQLDAISHMLTLIAEADEIDQEKQTAALVRIASCSPRMDDAGGENQRHCKLCEAMINEARMARGEELWPAVPHTKKGKADGQ